MQSFSILSRFMKVVADLGWICLWVAFVVALYSVMLDVAGYNASNNEGVVELGGGLIQFANPAKPSEKTFGVFTFQYGTNGAVDSKEFIPDFYIVDEKPILLKTNSLSTFVILNLSLGKIGLAPSTGQDSKTLNPGEFGILVPQKSH
jgi:hypothetical protein